MVGCIGLFIEEFSICMGTGEALVFSKDSTLRNLYNSIPVTSIKFTFSSLRFTFASHAVDCGRSAIGV